MSVCAAITLTAGRRWGREDLPYRHPAHERLGAGLLQCGYAEQLAGCRLATADPTRVSIREVTLSLTRGVK